MQSVQFQKRKKRAKRKSDLLEVVSRITSEAPISWLETTPTNKQQDIRQEKQPVVKMADQNKQIENMIGYYSNMGFLALSNTN